MTHDAMWMDFNSILKGGIRLFTPVVIHTNYDNAKSKDKLSEFRRVNVKIWARNAIQIELKANHELTALKYTTTKPYTVINIVLTVLGHIFSNYMQAIIPLYVSCHTLFISQDRSGNIKDVLDLGLVKYSSVRTLYITNANITQQMLLDISESNVEVLHLNPGAGQSNISWVIMEDFYNTRELYLKNIDNPHVIQYIPEHLNVLMLYNVSSLYSDVMQKLRKMKLNKLYISSQSINAKYINELLDNGNVKTIRVIEGHHAPIDYYDKLGVHNLDRVRGMSYNNIP